MSAEHVVDRYWHSLDYIRDNISFSDCGTAKVGTNFLEGCLLASLGLGLCLVDRPSGLSFG